LNDYSFTSAPQLKRGPLDAPTRFVNSSAARFLIMAGGTALGVILGYAGIQLLRQRAASLDQQIAAAADRINRQLPIAIDQNTELVAVGGLAGTLQYNYRLVRVSESDADTAALLAILRPKVRNHACSAPELRKTFLDRGVTVRFAYADKDLHRLFSIDVSVLDCALKGGA
jgi:hypothetical protein